MGLFGYIIAFFILFLPAFIAERKNRSFFLWMVYCAVLWPVALIHSFLIRDTTYDGLKVCPECAEWVNEAARTCPICGFNIAQHDAKGRAVQAAAPARKKAEGLKKKAAKKKAALPYDATAQTREMLDVALSGARQQNPTLFAELDESALVSLSNLVQHYLTDAPEPPSIPDGSSASLEEMLAANSAVNLWQSALKAYREYLENEFEVVRPAQELGDERAQERLTAAAIAYNTAGGWDGRRSGEVREAIVAAIEAYKAANPDAEIPKGWRNLT